MTRISHYSKYLTPEDHLQIQVCYYLRLQYPQAIFFHPTNEGKRSPFERYKAKLLGLCAGVPDLLIFNYNGLAIEFKVIRQDRKTGRQVKGRVSEAQSHWLKQLEAQGWRVAVVYGFDEGKEIIDRHFKEYPR